jgi:hypothetical protein
MLRFQHCTQHLLAYAAYTRIYNDKVADVWFRLVASSTRAYMEVKDISPPFLTRRGQVTSGVYAYCVVLAHELLDRSTIWNSLTSMTI